MINKQKLWFITLFSLILVLSVYYITMPSELLTTSHKQNNLEEKEDAKVSVTKSDILTALEVEKDEERSSLVAKYNEVLTDKKSTTEEKNSAYEGLKKIDEVKSTEEDIQKKINDTFKVKSFVKIDGNNISITINSKEHDYSSANKIMRLVQSKFDNNMYMTVKYQN